MNEGTIVEDKELEEAFRFCILMLMNEHVSMISDVFEQYLEWRCSISCVVFLMRCDFLLR